MAGRNAMLSLDAMEDLDTMAEIIGQVVLERRTDLLDDEDTRWRLKEAVSRSKAREHAQGRPFSRRTVNARLRRDEHLDFRLAFIGPNPDLIEATSPAMPSRPGCARRTRAASCRRRGR